MNVQNQNEFDYMTELEFAKGFLKNQVTLKDFCYMDDYKKTINKESKFIVSKKILFIGAGPIPMSMILFKEKGFICNGLDYSKEAISFGEKVLKKLNHTDIKLIYADARTFNDYGSYDTIILALEAGIDERTKQNILQKISLSVNSNTKILIRSSNIENIEGIYVNSHKYISNYFSITKKIKTFSGHCSTLIAC